MKKLKLIALSSLILIVACHHLQRTPSALTRDEIERAITELRGAYAAFNRGDIDRAVEHLDQNVEWTEPLEFPGGGTYYGTEGAKRYLAQSRAGAAEVISEPDKFIAAGDRICVFVNARVLPKTGGAVAGCQAG